MSSVDIELVERRTATTTATPTPDVSEGGYGWVVVLGCAVITWWYLGISYSWGIVQAALVRRGLASPSTLSFVGSSAVACISGLAVVNAHMIRHLGAQRTALLGITMIGVGQLLSSFAIGDWDEVLSASWSCPLPPHSTSTTDEVSRTGSCTRRGGLGGVVNSFFIDALIEKLDLGWTFRILGIITLATGIPAALLVKERTPIRTTGFVDPSLFRDPKFITLFLAGAIGTFPLFVPPFFLPLYSASLHLSARAGAAAGRDVQLRLRARPAHLSPRCSGRRGVGVAMGMTVTGWVGGYLMGAPIAGYLLSAYGGGAQDASLEAYHPAMWYAGLMALGAAGLVSLRRFTSSTKLFAKI
ncbi:Monocarboxylate transporter [Mycena indigotica]|uniref:Monocarboxylate transporter n=1 Tax=Mycena indigotica TaxID=2126181 RepID=A0A8H6WBH5_9AGAR|nr:Monocarboxylate transporter [Mycena indigotica]KAF7310246.1 Monocarboxylate transporter [Mycena indigotica]